MRILVVTTGIDRAETQMFIDAAKRNISVHVLADPGAQNLRSMEDAGIPVSPLRLTRRFDFAAIRQLRHIIATEQPDIIHVLRKPALFNVLQASRQSPARIVAYRGIVGNLSFFDPFSWLSFLHPRIDRIICVAEDIRRFLLEMRPGFLRLPPEKVVTIHKGHDVAWYRQPQPVSLAEFGIPDGVPVIGCVANMRRRKGIDLLVRAFDRIAGEFGAHLLLIGDIRDQRIHAAIAASPFRGQIHTPGFRQDAPALAGALDLFVLPSTKREGLPRAVIEAMAQGVPAVVTDAGGSKDVVRHGQDGLVVPAGDELALADAVAELLRDEPRRQRFGASAAQRIEADFNVEKTLQKTLQLYHELVQPQPHGS